MAVSDVWGRAREGVGLRPEVRRVVGTAESSGILVIIIVILMVRVGPLCCRYPTSFPWVHVLGRAGHQPVFLALRLVVFLLAARAEWRSPMAGHWKGLVWTLVVRTSPPSLHRRVKADS